MAAEAEMIDNQSLNDKINFLNWLNNSFHNGSLTITQINKIRIYIDSVEAERDKILNLLKELNSLKSPKTSLKTQIDDYNVV